MNLRVILTEKHDFEIVFQNPHFQAFIVRINNIQI